MERLYQELLGGLSSLSDFETIPELFEEVLHPYFPFDWTALYYGTDVTRSPGVVTGPTVHNDWHRIYEGMAASDKVYSAAVASPPGTTFRPRQLFTDPDDATQFCFDYILRHANTYHTMIMMGFLAPNGFAGFGFYRSDRSLPFKDEEASLLEKLASITTLAAKTFLMQQKLNLTSVLAEREGKGEVCAMAFDARLRLVESSNATSDFIEKYFPADKGLDVPIEVQVWIMEEIASGGRVMSHPQHWQFVPVSAEGKIRVEASTVRSPLGKLTLMVRFSAHDEKEDFSSLVRLGLTKREIEALEYLPLGYSNRQIALAMDIQEVSVKKHLRNAGKKLGGATRTETLYRAMKRKGLF